MPTQTDPQVIKLNNVRLSYPNLFKAKAMQNPDGSTGKPKFSATFLLDKKQHAKTIAEIEKLIERTALEKFLKKVPLKHKCLRDGNEKDDIEGYGDGVMFIPTTSETRPAVVNGKLTPIVEEDGKVYAGCYVNATIRIFAYAHPVGGKGVSASLRAVQFAKDGESLGGSGPVKAENEFEELGEEASDDVSDY